MSASRLARLARRLAGRRWWHKGRWGRARWLAGSGVRLSSASGAGWQGVQAVQGPRPPGEVQGAHWALDDPADELRLAVRPLPQLGTVTTTVPELKGLDP